jgi:3-deoxy-D-manno-octulosonic acid (KDO) 8-phosphate synthase
MYTGRKRNAERSPEGGQKIGSVYFVHKNQKAAEAANFGGLFIIAHLAPAAFD